MAKCFFFSKTKMGDKSYHTLLLMFLALQNQFRSFMDHRPGLTKEMTIHDLHTGLTYQPLAMDLDINDLDQEMNIHDLHTGLTYQPLAMDLGFDDLDQLTDLEEQSVVLEENLRRTEIEILRSRNSMSRRLRLRMVRTLRRRLKKLQTELRAAIKTLVGKSTPKYMGRTFSSRSPMPELKELVRERCPLRSQSCPNIPSEGLLDFYPLNKWRSLNTTISFKGSMEDIIKTLKNEMNFLEMRLKSIENKLEKLCYPGYQGQANSPLPSPQSAGQGLRSESLPSKSDSPSARETTCTATSHSSEQSGRHHLHAVHNTGHSERHQRILRAAPQPIGTVDRATIQEPPSSRILRAAPQPIGPVHRATIQEPPLPGLLRRLVQLRQNQNILCQSLPPTRILRAAPQPIGPVHRATIQEPPLPNTESESPTQQHRSQSNNPEVSPSQRTLRAAPQPIGTVDRATIQEPPSSGLLRRPVQLRQNQNILWSRLRPTRTLRAAPQPIGPVHRATIQEPPSPNITGKAILDRLHTGTMNSTVPE